MRKHIMMLVAMLLVVAIAVPALAEVEFKYGGQFRARWVSNDNFDGNDDTDDNRNYFDQRLRLYFTFVGSQNLKVVTKFEMGDTTWGGDTGRIGPGTGGNVGADATNVEMKNAYIEFNIPCTPTTALVGVQGINLLNSWIVDDDFSAAVLKNKLDPVVVTLGYIAGQNSNVTSENENIDSFFMSVDYAQGPLSASLVGYYQYGHDTLVSADPNTLTTPISGVVPSTDAFPNFFSNDQPVSGYDNNLFDLGLNVAYKLDWMSAYASFVKNLGSVDLQEGADPRKSHDYTGWMVDAGANFFYGPYTFNLGGFYTSGPEVNKNTGEIDDNSDIDWFTYPLATQKYFSEIMGGGILDREAPSRVSNEGTGKYWRGYGWPSNIWTITGGAAWQVLEKTKLSGSYWYFGTSEDVLSGTKNGHNEFSNDLGHEFDVYVTQGIVDGLTLDLVGAYMIAGDAFTANNEDEDAYEVGARLQWNF